MIAASSPVVIDPTLPPGAVVRSGEGWAFHCAKCASRNLHGFLGGRYAVVHTAPPLLLDQATGSLSEIPRAEESPCR